MSASYINQNCHCEKCGKETEHRTYHNIIDRRPKLYQDLLVGDCLTCWNTKTIEAIAYEKQAVAS